ncbi:hypothetical protein HNO88_002563 [Novosphingobium chloroacetimidivorans]|uniref:Uncharacterized protein n=1 Tax=Novosphingobium chloroacetimidivorans TaxID=1428314 RepID=A0A7W7NXA5_9SPHN|nr:hypothetical protein [Novosphingobium chloroacetimidivorans]MBB4859234.1 hypothetical protein [Novosphingobium chloroacetimidivorans]
MAFVADSSAGRTVDHERGYELFAEGGGPDGIEYWKITRADGQAIHFSTAWEPAFVEECIRRNPAAHKLAIYLIRCLRGQFSGLGRTGSDFLIVEALRTFQGFHGKPGDSDVVVFFEPADLSKSVPNWWAPILDSWQTAHTGEL